MAQLTTDDGVKLYTRKRQRHAGRLRPRIRRRFAQLRTQVRYFSRRYRCIVYNARGYPPSDVPEISTLFAAAGARRHPLRASMRSRSTRRTSSASLWRVRGLHFGFAYPERALSLLVPAAAMGKPVSASNSTTRPGAPRRRSREGMAEVAKTTAPPDPGAVRDEGSARYAEFMAQLKEHSTLGSANTMRGCRRAAVAVGPRRQDEGARRADLVATATRTTPALNRGC